MEESKRKGKLFVISASSGAGKTTLVNKVLGYFKEEIRISRAVTYTSRQPSKTEVFGVDYYFVSKVEFEEKIKQDFFIEYSTVYGAYYGFPKSALHVVDQGSSLMAIVDRAGAASLKAYKEDAVLVWIRLSDKQVLKDRLELRARDSQEEIAFRLALAKQELLQEASDQLYSYEVLNDNFDDALTSLITIITQELA